MANLHKPALVIDHIPLLAHLMSHQLSFMSKWLFKAHHPIQPFTTCLFYCFLFHDNDGMTLNISSPSGIFFLIKGKGVKTNILTWVWSGCRAKAAVSLGACTTAVAKDGCQLLTSCGSYVAVVRLNNTLTQRILMTKSSICACVGYTPVVTVHLWIIAGPLSVRYAAQ